MKQLSVGTAQNVPYVNGKRMNTHTYLQFVLLVVISELWTIIGCLKAES